MDKKRVFHNVIWVVLVLFCILGLFYPMLGIAAVVCMTAPSVYALIKGGRGWCGTYCPRGSFNDFILSKISLNRKVPDLLKSKVFRLIFLVLLLSFFGVQLILAWGDLRAVGAVFVRMIVVTTLITIALGITCKPRTWCHFCPMGTMAYYISHWRHQKSKSVCVQFDTGLCVNCKMCSKACPMSLDVLSYKSSCRVDDGDCIRCGNCVRTCPKSSLKLVQCKKAGQ